MWTLAVLIILIGAGAYFYSATPAVAPATAQNEIPNPGGTNLPAGDLTPTPTTPIASSSATVSASSSLKVQ
jgi:hypothetical protein